MPRPKTVTDEQMAAWQARLDACPDEPPFDYTPEIIAARNEAVCAGYWLDERLEAETSLTPNERATTRHSFGQICVGRDPWKVADSIALLCKHGARIPALGRVLARKLLDGELDGIFGPGATTNTAANAANAMKLLGFKNLQDILRMTGSKTVAEAKAKLQAQIDDMEKDFSR